MTSLDKSSLLPASAHAAAGLSPEAQPTRRHVIAGGAGAALAAALPPVGVRAGGADVIATYKAFAAAQNAGELAVVREMFTQDPPFLWVSDGMSIWGRDAAIERMALFRSSEIWRVTPDLDRAVAVELNAGAAYLHLPLELAIGPRVPGPDRLRFLVSMLAVRKDRSEDWRIAALFTTTEKKG
ncbi:hypothetical protein ABEG18_22050 [Alsobacter sp. KACC 23698]|uniref:DUF4440 domain-containing protein n=1 Tax=Alsobacter sp. KACC 23698 TaxID=3149229 RepID=A0AAU7JDY8_9HYPH